jgi:hypothetical protein
MKFFAFQARSNGRTKARRLSLSWNLLRRDDWLLGCFTIRRHQSGVRGLAQFLRGERAGANAPVVRDGEAGAEEVALPAIPVSLPECPRTILASARGGIQRLYAAPLPCSGAFGSRKGRCYAGRDARQAQGATWSQTSLTTCQRSPF